MSELDSGAAPAAAESTPAPVSAPEAAPSASPVADAPKPSFDDDLKANAFRIHQKNNPPRENGRFVPHIPTAKPIEEAAPETPATTDQPETASSEPAKEEPAIDAPQSWSAEMKAKFAALPPDVRAYVAERDKETFRQFSRMGEQVKAHEPLRAAAEQHAHYLRQIGQTPESALNEVVRVSQILDRNPAAAIAELAQKYRVNLQALAAGQPQQPAPQQQRAPQLDPEYVRTQLDRLLDERAVKTAIDNFAKDTPDFSELEPQIEAFATVIRREKPDLSPEKVLKEAYDQARWGNPTIRERILADQRKAEEEKAKAEQEKQVKEAKRHQALNQRGNAVVSFPKETLDETLRREIEKRVPRRA